MNKIKTFFAVTVAAISGFFFFSCNQTEELNGTWNTCYLEKDGIAQEIAVSKIIFATEGNKLLVAGESGVNLFNGTVKVNKGKIQFVNVGSTRMMGDPKAMEFEDIFLEAISYADGYSLENGVLTITASSKNLKLQFQK